MATIPASKFVGTNPGVINAGGSALQLNGLFLTKSARIPIGVVQSFATAAAVGAYFGLGSNEYTQAIVYFNGYTNKTITPGNLLMAQYPATAVGAFVRGGPVSMTLAQLQAITGNISVVVDAGTWAATGVTLAGASSFSAAAALIQAALDATPPTEASFTGVIAGTVLTASSVTGGTLSVGQQVVGAGVAAGTIIESLGTGTGLAGTYNINNTQTVASESMTAQGVAPTVTYDSQSAAFIIASGITGVASAITFPTGSLATQLLLTQAGGAVTSQGAAAATPATFMPGIVAQTQNWALFTTLFDPDNGSGNTQKLAFAAWTNGQNNRYGYVPFDTDAAPTVTVPATESLGYQVGSAGLNYSGTAPVWESGNDSIAAFVLGVAASVNFNTPNGRLTFAYKSQTGLVASVTNEQIADNLEANGYNMYDATATAAQNFVFLYPGTVSGPFQWLDSFVNQIWLNASLQLALLELETTVDSLPYNADGYGAIETACSPTITQAVKAGVIREGVTLSAEQINDVNTIAGMTGGNGNGLGTILQTQGWYLQIIDATPQVRQARQSPTINFFYTDGESVQQIDLSSYLIQ